MINQEKQRKYEKQETLKTIMNQLLKIMKKIIK